MALTANLLEPISGSNPAGVSLRYSDLYEKIKEARRYDQELPSGVWQRALKTAEYPKVIKLTNDALAGKSKDLQLAAWLTEALIHTEGFAGLKQGLDLICGLIEKFWDHLYPELEDGDAELRATALEWLAITLDQPLKQVELTQSGYSFFLYKQSREVGYEKEVAGNDARKKAREAAIKEKKLTPEEFDKDVVSTPKESFEATMNALDGALESLQALSDLCDARFGDVAPNFSKVRGTLEEIRQVAKNLLQKKIEAQPKPAPPPPPPQPAATPLASTTAPGAVASPAAAAPAPAPTLTQPGPAPAPATVMAAAPTPAVATQAAPAALSLDPSSRDDAMKRLAAIVRYLRKQQPVNPGAYMIWRGLRWGELRAKVESPDTALLEAPPTEVRQEIKKLIQESKWQQALEASEEAMALSSSRAWLDLQRYAVTACQGLGNNYSPVAAAIRSEVRSLLFDYPQLAAMSLADDTPTANNDTQAWIRDEVAPKPVASAPAQPSAAPSSTAPVDTFERATQAMRAGRAEEAIAMLMHEVAREDSGRGRFLRRIQVAHLCMAGKQEAVAYPILSELVADIDARKLDQWEAPSLIAQVLVMLYRCIEKLNRDSAEKQRIYSRICQIDPVQALGCSR